MSQIKPDQVRSSKIIQEQTKPNQKLSTESKQITPDHAKSARSDQIKLDQIMPNQSDQVRPYQARSMQACQIRQIQAIGQTRQEQCKNRSSHIRSDKARPSNQVRPDQVR